MTLKILSFLLVAYGFTMGTNAYAGSGIKKDKELHVTHQKLLRFTDTKEEYGKFCEEYSYISSIERLKLLKQNNFMLGDLLSDSLSIAKVNPNHLVETNITACNNQSMYVGEYAYEEKLSYLNENIMTIEVFQYSYGAGAAHGNGHIAHYVYDRDYGMRLNWKDLFIENYAFDDYILERVLSEIADKDFITYFKTENKILNYSMPGYFAITDKGLLIQYGKYEITPGASGLPSMVVPKEVLKQYMSKEVYERCFDTEDQVIIEARNDY